MPTKTAAIERLARDGYEPAAIAALVDSPVTSVRTIISKLRRRGVDVPTTRRPIDCPAGLGSRIEIALPGPIADRLSIEASSRGVSIRDLVLALLTAAVRDDMVGAILDDDEREAA